MAQIDGIDVRGRGVDRPAVSIFLSDGTGRRRLIALGGAPIFWAIKRATDIFVSAALLVPLAGLIILIACANPFLNPGRVFYAQTRMGRDCRPFRAIKFRSMSHDPRERGPDDPLEYHRITPLGLWLRATRIDELPQILNVLFGDMSLIGPRPDVFSHAQVYLRRIPHYRARHSIRPGISGLAQISVGYAEGTEATRLKVQADMTYIERASFGMDLWIFWQTLLFVALWTRRGTRSAG